MGQSEEFWNHLFSSISGRRPVDKGARKAYMLEAYKKHLPAVKWNHLRRTGMAGISPREGHLACTFTTPNEQRICVTGGFSDDDTIYVLNVSKADQNWRWSRLQPRGERAAFVYGASLTPLPNTTSNVARALRFGGFRSGGYSDETNELMMLTLTDGENYLSAEWKVIPTQNPQLAAPRAYHSATLVDDRFLFIIGGMMHRESMLKEAILDTHTWTWLDRSISFIGDEKPSGRHGHSVIFDSERNRLVLFGGGSGSDLLRSGSDNTEVWELNMNYFWQTDLLASLPWRWSKIHGDSSADEEEQNEDDDVSQDRSTSSNRTFLSPAESLCLGRCHIGVKISRDSVLLLFGSGRPSTNGAIAYDLRYDRFMRPQTKGALPTPRFTGVAAFLENEGYLFVHGGYSSQESNAIGDMSILDLAPYLNREFKGLEVESNKRCYGAISDEEAKRGRRNSDVMTQRMLEALMQAPGDERQMMAAEMIRQLVQTGEMGGRNFMLLSMIANGAQLMFRSDVPDETDESNNDSDSDYQELN